ncbi:ABC transporter permease [Erysipelothrix sp. HDW6C]|uniref:ABC transporter permease n=1 Tax=Erysipelothrix sp. HDW6C TaxID=2714930 RepID=UPI00140E0876|nr:ABC transporter permease [Erysipelothrix sp. HDW6C]QIK70310.1 ABC transporter permease [Erysipelothrix sp. HDW6C]
MNHFKRAWLSVIRRKGKSLILLVVVFILGNVIAGAFSIQQASVNVEKTIKKQLGAVATIEVDYEKLQEESIKNPELVFEYDGISEALIAEVAKLEQVRYYDYSIPTSFRSKTVKLVSEEESGVVIGGSGSEYGEYFNATGVEYPPVTDIDQGKIELVSGRVFTPEDITSGKLVMLVSEKFASTNGVSVGDSLVFQNIITDYNTEGKETVIAQRDVSLEIIGTFKPLIVENSTDPSKPTPRSDAKSQELSWRENELNNRLYIPNKVAIQEAVYNQEELAKVHPEYFEDTTLTAEQMIMRYIQPTFVLNDPESVEPFRDAVNPMLGEYYKVVTSSDAYDSIAGPVKSLDTMSKITLYVAIGAAILILSLVIVLFLRDRKHELGIYLSLGDRRNGVLSQIVMEVVMVAFVGLSLSLVTGNMIANSLSTSMMENNMTDPNGPIMYGNYYGGPQTDLTEEDVRDAYKVELTPQYIGLFYLIGLGVTIGSTIVPIVYITRLNPKKIMM